MLLIAAPGQGSQRPGLLAPWSAHPAFAAHLATHAESVGLDLSRLGTSASAGEIRDTAVAQPLLVATGLAAARALAQEGAGPVREGSALAGHSVGAVTAAALAGCLADSAAVELALVRGRAMAQASAAAATGMVAVVGGDPDQVREAIARHGLDVAVVNGRAHVVAAGTLPRLARLTAQPPRGSRVLPLEVAGAFHSPFMRAAVDPVRHAVAALEVRPPAAALVSDLDGAVVRSSTDVADRLVEQLVGPVRWDLCTATFERLGVTGLLELPPTGALTALARRALPHVETFALSGPERLAEAAAFVERHRDPDRSDAVRGATMRPPQPGSPEEPP